MKNKRQVKCEFVNIHDIQLMDATMYADASKLNIEKSVKALEKWGYSKTLVLVENDRGKFLVSGYDIYKAYKESKLVMVPAAIIDDPGETDSIVFSVQASLDNDKPNMIAIATAISKLIHEHHVSRNQIARDLNKSPSWVTNIEKLALELCSEVKSMVVSEHIAPRTAQEIAKLPKDCQVKFANVVSNKSISKDSASKLVKFHNEADSHEDKQLIFTQPEVVIKALKEEPQEKHVETKPTRNITVYDDYNTLLRVCSHKLMELKKLTKAHSFEIGEELIDRVACRNLYSAAHTIRRLYEEKFPRVINFLPMENESEKRGWM